MVVIPTLAALPDVTKPVAAFTAATSGLLLLQVPFGDPLSLSCVVSPPAHNDVFPSIATGVALTEKVMVAAGAQPLA